MRKDFFLDTKSTNAFATWPFQESRPTAQEHGTLGYICGAGGIQGAFMQFGCSKGSNVLKKSHKSQSSSFIQLRGLGRSFVHSHFTRSTLSFDVYKFFTMRRPHVKLQISYRRVCDLTHNPQARNTQERLTRKCHVFI